VFFTGVPPFGGNFFSINRLIAGIADATLVVESAQSGGSLTTADFAHGYNKELFCVPGRLTDRYSAGCNRLIGTLKAQRYTGPESVAEAIGIVRVKDEIKKRHVAPLVTALEKRLYAFLVKNGRSFPSSMLKFSGIDRAKLFGVLARLTLSGAITHHNDNSYEV
jgi:DNA processing protein